jgi:hypothetical protein
MQSEKTYPQNDSAAIKWIVAHAHLTLFLKKQPTYYKFVLGNNLLYCREPCRDI